MDIAARFGPDMSGRGGGYLVQLVIPLNDNEGQPYPDSLFKEINASLAENFGGVTAYSRSPAKGIWVAGDQNEQDDVVLVEVMTRTLDRDWWLSFRQKLEIVMRQSEIVVRSQAIERL